MPNQALATTTGQPGTWLLRSRHNYLVSGATPERGGTGEPWLAGELLVAALASCATSIVADAAAGRGLALHYLSVSASSERDPDEPGRYAAITLAFDLEGPSRQEAEALVAEFQATCPIYGTLSRGAPVRVDIRTTE
ncbi:OsmC-like protein [Pigmentiphaga humi]|uniref:OsmC-like protein n=1 Tax=Pigmentiphaga humi TaxID=2478468 RepID=A0A3P4AVH2_9BURK|nr:OsmC family protein [Pigmentiphaga humi]VCU68044.1 OsmC-like protein [Pigmentiphaga humi]